MGIVVGKCWSTGWTHLQMFSVSTVLGKKTSTVEHSRGAGAILPCRVPPPHWTGRGPVNESIMFGELSIFVLVLLLFSLILFFKSVNGWLGMDL